MYCAYFDPDDRGGTCLVGFYAGPDYITDGRVCAGCPAFCSEDGELYPDHKDRRLKFWELETL